MKSFKKNRTHTDNDRVKIAMAIMFAGDLRLTDSQQAMAIYVIKKIT